MVKQFKLIFERISHASIKKPNIIELITFCSNAVCILNERPITPLSDDTKDFTVITPASLLTTGFDKYAPIGVAHDKDHLRRGYRFNLALAERFWNNGYPFISLGFKEGINGEKGLLISTLAN